MPIPPPHWSLGELLFLGTAIGACITFAVTLIAGSTYVALGDKAQTAKTTVTAAVRPSQDDDIRQAA